MRILHITAHMGAGAGKAISGLAMSDDSNRHIVILLEEPEKTDHIRRCEQMGIEIIICPQSEQLCREVAEADVVIMNWWHHPLTYQALIEISDVPSRIILWSHVNGLNYPKLKLDFMKCFDACMFTSKASFQNTDWSEEEKDYICKKSELVYGMGDFNPQNFKAKCDYGRTQEAQIGYVGTLDYAKLHPNFVNWIKETVNCNRNIRFMVAGDLSPTLTEDVKKEGISENTEFLGFRTDIPELLCAWDIFIYPLNPVNFATTENALLEAMAAGLPIVASDGMIERTIIDDGKNGFLVSDEHTFANRVQELVQNEELRRRLGQHAKESVIGAYDKKANLLRFISVLDTVVKRPKEIHDLNIGNEAFEWFLVGCGNNEAKLLEELSQYTFQNDEWRKMTAEISGLGQIYKGESKGSPKQFSKYYPIDKRLDTLIKIMEEVQEKNI